MIRKIGFGYKKNFDLFLYVAGLLVLLYMFYGQISAFAISRFEDVLYTLAPTGERAYAYGNRHFNATNKYLYDIERASYYFKEAARLDPGSPYVNHQLARIEFLYGHFTTAQLYIDRQIAEHGTSSPSSFYIRGLIEGYAGDYESAVKDYKFYVELQEHPDWAALNDYAWVLLKAGHIKEAADVTERGLRQDPYNVWLLNSNSIALYELGENEKALTRAKAAASAADQITENMWLRAYPGNDPKIARIGIEQLKESIQKNIHSIQSAIASSTL